MFVKYHFLQSCLFLKLKQALKYNNMSNDLNVLFTNNKKNIELANINNSKSATLSSLIF